MTNSHVLTTVCDAHLLQFLGYRSQGLGIFSKHALKSSRARFAKVYPNYKRNPKSPDYGHKLLAAASQFNAFSLLNEH